MAKAYNKFPDGLTVTAKVSGTDLFDNLAGALAHDFQGETKVEIRLEGLTVFMVPFTTETKNVDGKKRVSINPLTVEYGKATFTVTVSRKGRFLVTDGNLNHCFITVKVGNSIILFKVGIASFKGSTYLVGLRQFEVTPALEGEQVVFPKTGEKKNWLALRDMLVRLANGGGWKFDTAALVAKEDFQIQALAPKVPTKTNKAVVLWADPTRNLAAVRFLKDGKVTDGKVYFPTMASEQLPQFKQGGRITFTELKETTGDTEFPFQLEGVKL